MTGAASFLTLTSSRNQRTQYCCLKNLFHAADSSAWFGRPKHASVSRPSSGSVLVGPQTPPKAENKLVRGNPEAFRAVNRVLDETHVELASDQGGGAG